MRQAQSETTKQVEAKAKSKRKPLTLFGQPVNLDADEMSVQVRESVALSVARENNIELSPRQLRAVEGFSRLGSAISYVLSIKGVRCSVAPERNRSYGTDLLAAKNPRSILEMMSSSFGVSDSHHPLGGVKAFEGKYVGVEIECFVPKSRVAELMDLGAARPASLDHVKVLAEEANLRRVSVKNDGSIDAPSGYIGVEFTVLDLRGEMKNLRKLCDFLLNLNAKVNKSCGLHVHLDARHLYSGRSIGEIELSRIKRNFTKALPVLLTLVPETRRNNRYCRPVVCGNNRYSAVNLTALSKFKTVEVRLHSGTTDFTKISNWVNLCAAIFDAPMARPSAKVESVNDLDMYFPKVTGDMMEYFEQRRALFAGEQSNQASEGESSEQTAPALTPIANGVDANSLNQVVTFPAPSLQASE